MFDQKTLRLYNAIIKKHSRYPANNAKINHITHRAVAINKFCGDEVHLNINYDNKNFLINEIQLIAEGCSINIASASIVSNLILGLNSEKILYIHQIYNKMLDNQKLDPKEHIVLGDLIYFRPLSNIKIRKKCSQLIWNSIRNIQPIKPI